MKELFGGLLVKDYYSFLMGDIVSKVIVTINNNMAKEIITGQEFKIITINDKDSGVCDLINISDNRKVLQIIADYLVINYDLDVFIQKLDLTKEKKELPKVKKR